MFEYKFRPPAAWEIKLLTARQLLQPILDTPSLESPATRLALSGERIIQNARDTVARSQLEIADAYRCRR
jgi:hypothetical protein